MNSFRSVLLPVIFAAACGRIDPDEQLAAARASLVAGDVGVAAVQLSNVLQVNPDNLEAQILRGRVALALGDYASAVRELERARALGAANETIAVDLASAYTETGAHERSIEVLDAASAALDSDQDYWLTRAEALIQMGSTTAALTSLDRAASIGNETPRYLIVRGRAAQASDALDDAERFFSRAAAAAPGDAEVHSALGEFYAHTARLKEASDELAKSADIYRAGGRGAREAALVLRLVQIYVALNDADSAAAAASRLAERAPHAAYASYARGLVDYHSGRLDSAATHLLAALNSQPNNLQVLTLLGAVHLARGNLGQAEQQLLKVLSFTPRDPEAAKLLAETRLRQERPQAALDALQPLAGSGLQDSRVGLLTGLANVFAGNAEQGLVYLEQAAALDPDDPLLQLELARAYAAMGRTEEVSRLLRAGLESGGGGTALEARFVQLFAYARSQDPSAGRQAAAELAASFPNDARALTVAAMYYQLVNERQHARELLERAVERDGRFVMARRLLAGALVQEGRTTEAEEQLREVLEVEPDNVEAMTGLAQLAALRGDLVEGERLLRGAADKSGATAPRLMLARLLIGQSRFSDARARIEEASRSAPEDAEVLATRGLLSLAEGRTTDAVAFLREANSRVPNRLGTVLALADAQLANDQSEEARSTLQQMLLVAPRSLPLRVALGVTELRLGNVDAALTLAKAIQVDFPAQSEGYLLEGQIDIARRRYEAAVANMLLAYDRESTWPVLGRLVEALRLAGRGDEVVGLLETWLGAHADDHSARLTLASVLQSAGNHSEALRHYEHVLTRDENNVVALNNAAWSYQRSDGARALALAQRAFAAAPDNAAVLDTLAIVLAGQNRDEDAITYLARAVNLAPEALEIRFHLGELQARMGRPAEARATLEALLREGAHFEQRAAAERLLESL